MSIDDARPGTAGARSGIPGTTYLVCIEAPGLHVTGDRYARHYLGWVSDEDVERVYGLDNPNADVLLGNALASPMLREARSRGLGLIVERVWYGRERSFRDRLRRRSETPQLCPACSGDRAYRRAT